MQVRGFTVSREYSTQSYAVIRDLPPVDGIQPPGEALCQPSGILYTSTRHAVLCHLQYCRFMRPRQLPLRCFCGRVVHGGLHRKTVCQQAGAGKEIPCEPEGGRYIHFFIRTVLNGYTRGFGAYMSRDGRGYSGALILACRKHLPDEIRTAEGFAAALRREFKNLPEVRAMQLVCMVV